MKILNSRYFMLIAFFLYLISPSTASARGIILITHGNTIAKVGEIHSEIMEIIKEIPQAPNEKPPKVGYKYDYAGLFWIDFWTSDGTFCLYNESGYDPISEEVAAKLLGIPEKKLRRPFFYKFPLGWVIVAGIISFFMIKGFIDYRRNLPEKTIFEDSRYQKALEIRNQQLARLTAESLGSEQIEDESPRSMSNEEKKRIEKVAFDAGVYHLISVGIPAKRAEREFERLLRGSL